MDDLQRCRSAQHATTTLEGEPAAPKYCWISPHQKTASRRPRGECHRVLDLLAEPQPISAPFVDPLCPSPNDAEAIQVRVETGAAADMAILPVAALEIPPASRHADEVQLGAGALSTPSIQPSDDDEVLIAPANPVTEDIAEGAAERDAAPTISTTTISVDDCLMRRLLALPSSRAVHAYVVQLLTDAETPLGRTLRANIVRSLAHSIADEGSTVDWYIVPGAVIADLEAANEVEAFVQIALRETRTSDPAITDYVNSVAVTFDSFTALDPTRARSRIFATSDSLTAKLRQWVGSRMSPCP